MKFLKKILIGIGIILLLVVVALTVFLQNSKPKYSGEIKLKGLKAETEIYFDDYGIPHLYASSKEEAWFALGFVHAQERLFQMELLRRIGSGRLAEILGKDLLSVDIFFRTLGIRNHAETMASEYLTENKEPFQRAAFSYMNGINAFIENGKTPVEFHLLGIPKEKFTPTDFYVISGYMAFTFQEALKTDPALSDLYSRFGKEYLKAFVKLPEGDSISALSEPRELLSMVNKAQDVFSKIPAPPFIGSNAWAVSAAKSKSGKPMLCNDTHIGYSQPSVWYEAHIEYPGFSLYGNFLAGYPFPLVGHTRSYAWGLTMLEDDDLDLFREKLNPDDSSEYFVNDHWEKFILRKEVVKIKNSKDTIIHVRSTRHGPVMNKALQDFSKKEKQPISLWWVFTNCTGNILQTSYSMCHATDMNSFRNACSRIESPGLNVIYADTSGNIAWWACGKLVKRPPHVVSKTILDGSSGKDEPLGFYDFEENPKSENPECGYLVSANRIPDSLIHFRFPGYYASPHRSRRIDKLLNEKEKLNTEEMKKIQLDDVNESYKGNSKIILHALHGNPVLEKTIQHQKAAQALKEWNGSHSLTDIAPVIYYKLLSIALDEAMADEMDSALYPVFKNSHCMKNAISDFLNNNNSPFWDNKTTEVKIETREEIIAAAFDSTIAGLINQLGPEVKSWTWQRVHTVEFVHAIGRQKPMNNFFNAGPFPVAGGNETINCQGFPLSQSGVYNATYGPAMRIVIDLADIENAESILPTGQSGNFISGYYDDQAKMYVNGKWRKMMMNKNEIMNRGKKLILLSDRLPP